MALLTGAALGLLSGCPAEEDATAPSRCAALGQLQSRVGTTVFSPVPGAGAFKDYLIDGTSVVASGPNPCSNAIAARLDDSACGVCMDNATQCEALVRTIFERLPAACSSCGDGQCLVGVETAFTCPLDCGLQCGDGLCEGEETGDNCPLDCLQPCGDGLCAGNESPASCPQDCNYTVGDGLCTAGENPVNSPADCAGQTLGQPCESDADCRGAVCDGSKRCNCDPNQGGVCATTTCGDGFCQSYENTLRCPEDCCGAARCDLDQGAVCLDRMTVGHCAIGDGACPAVVADQVCAFGCLDGACTSCPADPALQPCVGPPSCWDGSTARVCRPLSGFEDCWISSLIPCPEGGSCTQGVGCSACDVGGCRQATIGLRRCGDDGVTVEACTLLEGQPCPVWLAARVCVEGLVCNIPNREGECL